MHHWTVQYNTLTAAEFIRLWESVWDGAPTREQVQLALAHTLFRVTVYDGEQVIGMARMLGDLGMNYYQGCGGIACLSAPGGGQTASGGTDEIYPGKRRAGDGYFRGAVRRAGQDSLL